MTWTTYNPGLIVFLIDQSGSMKNSITSGMSRSVLLVKNNQLFLCTEDRDCIFKFVSLLIAEFFIVV